ncbi:MAG: SsrA-binding protein SmpB [Bacteroidota bacterium]|mgnify:FL=1|nr:SsrA-binding protein SmpB [Bacteroidota bacterium]MEC8602569.1 SsrA-binding protein SmpB [Bacteroidota bacterium]
MQEKINIVNKKAKFKYFLLKKYIAGLVLNGSEIKSIRQKKVNIDRSFCNFFNDELYVNNIVIENYINSSSFNNDRNKIKLLLNKNELVKIKKELNDVGVTIVATKLFINDKGFAKLEISTAKGKKNYDKREVIKKRENKLKIDRIKKSN